MKYFKSFLLFSVFILFTSGCAVQRIGSEEGDWLMYEGEELDTSEVYILTVSVNDPLKMRSFDGQMIKHKKRPEARYGDFQILPGKHLICADLIPFAASNENEDKISATKNICMDFYFNAGGQGRLLHEEFETNIHRLNQPNYRNVPTFKQTRFRLYIEEY